MDLTALTLRDLTADLVGHNDIDTGTGDTNLIRQGSRTTLRRCRTREQGTALLIIGHAIEYLFDARLVQQQTATAADREALAILLNANLSVYNEGAEVVPLKTRLRRWLHGTSPMNTATVTR